MNYDCGMEVMLGDEVMVSCGPNKQALARVVAIGLDSAAKSIDPDFYAWAKNDGMIDENSFVVEWIGDNPLAHDDPHHAPVGNYMTLDSISSSSFVRRGGN